MALVEVIPNLGLGVLVRDILDANICAYILSIQDVFRVDRLENVFARRAGAGWIRHVLWLVGLGAAVVKGEDIALVDEVSLGLGENGIFATVERDLLGWKVITRHGLVSRLIKAVTSDDRRVNTIVVIVDYGHRRLDPAHHFQIGRQVA